MGKLLTTAQVERYQRDGILFPVPVLSPGDTSRFQAAFEEVAARLGGRPVAPAWVALIDSAVDNGCMRAVPGSHRRPILPHRDTYAPDNRLSRGQEIAVEVEEQDAVDVVLRAGEMSDRSRIGFAPRFTTPKTRQIDGEAQDAELLPSVGRGLTMWPYEATLGP